MNANTLIDDPNSMTEQQINESAAQIAKNYQDSSITHEDTRSGTVIIKPIHPKTDN